MACRCFSDNVGSSGSGGDGGIDSSSDSESDSCIRSGGWLDDVRVRAKSCSNSSSSISSSSSTSMAVTVVEALVRLKAIGCAYESSSSSESESLSDARASQSASSTASSGIVSAHWMCLGFSGSSEALAAPLTVWLNQLSCSRSASARSSIRPSRRLAWPTSTRRSWSALAASLESLPRAVWAR